MKKLFLIVAAMFAVVSFSACSDDDDNKDASIVGTWQITYYEGWAPMHFTYSVNGNTLTMTESTGEFQNVFQIKKLSQSQLVLFRSGEDAHEKFEETETYKRIK